MVRYATTIFLSAFLLFQVQPLIGKFILPWFGGSPAVWTQCLLFFQVVLLAGYAYAHFLSSRLSPRAQTVVHLTLLAVSLWFLPIEPNPAVWKPSGGAISSGRILLLLAGTIGLPYFLLSSTGPLLQESFRRETGRPPYRLYSLSNAGSLLALLTYPFVFEPQLKLWTQIVAWSSGYALFVVLCGICAWRFARLPAHSPEADPELASADSLVAKPKTRDIVLWLSLAACGSVMLLATTNQLTQEIPSVPFLWVVALALYLLSFIICFDRELWYHRGVFFVMLAIAASLSCYALWRGYEAPLWQQLTIYPGTLFVCCMVCHGELARARPAPQYATLFYLIVSAGGAMGGVLVAIVAPLVLREFWEYQIGMATTVLLAFVALAMARMNVRLPRRADRRAARRVAKDSHRVRLAVVGVALVALGLGGGAWWAQNLSGDPTIRDLETTRNFFGVLRVRDVSIPNNPQESRRVLSHGRILHGFQYLDAEKSRWPTSYFTASSGVGLAIERHPRRFLPVPAQRALRIGVVGLGSGTLAASGKRGDTICFYEIDPEIIRISNDYFTYRKNSAAKIEIVLGDARIEMERQIAAGQPQRFDVLAIDAFSSDAIPMHLLTLESAKLYRQHLKPDGILCIHISNLFLELSCVVRGIAKELDCSCAFIETYPNIVPGTAYSAWGIVTFNQEFLNDPAVVAAIQASNRFDNPPVVWTDDYASLWQVLKDFRGWFSASRP